MTIHLVNVDPLNPAGRPTPRELTQLGVAGVRLVPRYESESAQDYCLDLAAHGLSLAYVLDHDALGDGDGQLKRLAWFVGNLPRPICWQIANEPDGGYVPNHPDGNDPQTRWERARSSWTMSQDDWWALHLIMAKYLRQQGQRIATASLVSGHPSWADGVLQVLDADFVSAHPYSKTPEEALWLLTEYQAIRPDLPLAVPEWNRPADQIADFVRMLGAETEWAAWFAWSDGMVPGFGLVDRNGQPKDEYRTLQSVLMAAAGGAPPVVVPPVGPVQFTLGFLAWSRLDPELLGQPLEAERGFAPGVSLCETTTGSLYWIDERAQRDVYTWSTDLNAVFGFRRRSDDQRFAWRPGMAHAVEVV